MTPLGETERTSTNTIGRAAHLTGTDAAAPWEFADFELVTDAPVHRGRRPIGHLLAYLVTVPGFWLVGFAD